MFRFSRKEKKKGKDFLKVRVKEWKRKIIVDL